MSYVPQFDGLRALAFVAVLAFHLAPVSGPVSGGFIGVDVFFVLSSYLLTSSLRAELSRTGTIDVRAFLSRRVTRMLPALLVFLLAYVCLAPAIWPGLPLQERLRDAALVMTALSDYAIALTGQPDALRHTWSLACEIQFYLLWPLIVRRLSQLDRPCMVLLMLWLLALLWRAHVLATSGWEQAYHRFDTRCSGFLVGALLAFTPQLGTEASRVLRMLAGPAAALMIALTLSATFHTTQALLIACPCTEWCCACLVLSIAADACPPLIMRLLSAPPLVWTGTLSYGLYLWHFPFCLGVRSSGNYLAAVLCVLSMAFFAAFASFRLVEQPALRLRSTASLLPRPRRAWPSAHSVASGSGSMKTS